jgi:hypothetical protein
MEVRRGVTGKAMAPLLLSHLRLKVPMKNNAGSHLHRWLGIGACVSILAAAAPKFGQPATAISLQDFGPNGSVNSALKHTLHQPDCAERIAAWLNDLPKGSRVLVVEKENSIPAGLVGDLIPYLAWPRPVKIVYGPQLAAAEIARNPGRYSAVCYCFVPTPAGLPVAKSFGPALACVTPLLK